MTDKERQQFPGIVPKRPQKGITYARIISWIIVIVIAIVIFALSDRTSDMLDNQSGIFSFIKQWLADGAIALFGHPVDISPVGHFVEYLLLGAALLNALQFNVPLKKALIGAIVIASAYGVTDEFHQWFVPTRSTDPTDWLVDTVAAAIGAVIVFLIWNRVRKKAD